MIIFLYMPMLMILLCSYDAWPRDRPEPPVPATMFGFAPYCKDTVEEECADDEDWQGEHGEDE